MLKLLSAVLEETDFSKAEYIRRCDLRQCRDLRENIDQAIDFLQDEKIMTRLRRTEPQAGKRWAVCAARDKLIKANSLLRQEEIWSAGDDFAAVVEMLSELYDRRMGDWQE